jgi:hypothetical protein
VRQICRLVSIRVEVGLNDPAEQEETLLLLLALWHAVPQGLVDPAPRRAVWPGSGGALRLVQALYKRRSSIVRRFLLDQWPASVRFPTTDDGRPPLARTQARDGHGSVVRVVVDALWRRRSEHTASEDGLLGTPHAAARRELGR